VTRDAARRGRSRTRARVAPVALALTSLAGCSALSTPDAAPRDCAVARSSLQPVSGAWFGASLDWRRDSVAGYARRLGAVPAVVGVTAGLPLAQADRAALDAVVGQSERAGSMVMLTLEPRDGLAAVTDDVAEGLARDLDGYDRRGVPVFVRFAPEMNGSWHAWGQRPMRYVDAFRRLADAVHDLAPGSPMVWSPAYGGGYPFPGGPNETHPGTLAEAILDVDGDGDVTQADDPYGPYWPGAEAVDWVGLSVRQRGPGYLWAENRAPEPGEFVDILRGTYDGARGDETSVPDFYATYGEQLRRPLLVADTSAFYAPGRGGAWELTVKRAWWRQVFRAGQHEALPMLRMVTWLEQRQGGSGSGTGPGAGPGRGPVTPSGSAAVGDGALGGPVDWSVTGSPVTLAPFRRDLPGWLHLAADVPRCS